MQQFPDGSSLSLAEARRCFRKGASACVEQIHALPYRKPTQNAAGLLRDSILFDYSLPPKFVADAKARETARKREEEKKSAGVSGASGPVAPPERNARRNRPDFSAPPAEISVLESCPPALTDAWRHTLETMRAIVNRPTWEIHLSHLAPVEWHPDSSPPHVVVVCRSHFTREWLAKRHGRRIGRLLATYLRLPDLAVTFRAADSPPPPANPRKEKR